VPGQEADVVQALAAAVLAGREAPAGVEAPGLGAAASTPPAAIAAEQFSQAVAILRDVAEKPDQRFVVIYAPEHLGQDRPGECAKAAANLCIAVRGTAAARHLIVLPTDANVNGAREMGVGPDIGPGRPPLATPGQDLYAMLEAARQGTLKAMVIVGDNPMLWAADKAAVKAGLEALDFLLVIDGLLTDTAKLAHVVLADLHVYGKYGTFINADRRLLKLAPARRALGDQRPALELLTAIGRGVAAALKKPVQLGHNHPQDVTAEIAATIPTCSAAGQEFVSGQAYVRETPAVARLQPVEPAAAAAEPATGRFRLLANRTLFHSIEGASVHAPDADKLHREEFVEMHPQDAETLGVKTGDRLTLSDGRAEVSLPVFVTENVRSGSLLVPLLYDGGAITALFQAESSGPPVVQARVPVSA
jgi:predicted molibdopterin-dependent oxidoreductase YjgC